MGNYKENSSSIVKANYLEETPIMESIALETYVNLWQTESKQKIQLKRRKRERGGR